MIKRELGTLRRLDARDVWTDEARDFTPWLKANISILGAALGDMDLDLVEAEAAVGPFACDLVAKDVSSDRWVVIENQLEKTDHRHLGQLLTYGAGKGAAVFVWIATDFTEEHRAALQWLNDHSDEESAFFGVQVEVVTIDDDPRAAPNFKLVAYPNEFVKGARIGTRRPLSEKGAAYKAFFDRLLSRYKQRFPNDTNVSRSSTVSWLSLAMGRGGFETGWAFTQDKRFRVETYIDSVEQGVSKAHFDALRMRQGEIEGRLGHALEWQRLDQKRACRIASYYDGQPVTVLDADETLLPLTEWAVDEMKKMRDVLRPYVSALPGAVQPLDLER